MDAKDRKEPLYQVVATEKATGKLVVMPMFPRVMREVAEEFASTVRIMIATGKEKRYADPMAVPHLASASNLTGE